jgi:uncharacterized glyoxalase superfamily protein PhnB
MPVIPKATRATVTPCLRYRDAPAAIAWLCKTFGFEKQLVVPDEQGGILHAQLSFGNGMLMLGSERSNNAYHDAMSAPGSGESMSICLVVNDADLIYERVREAGTAILIDIADASYGGRGFTCRDLEGHIWSIGTYDPWQQQ